MKFLSVLIAFFWTNNNTLKFTVLTTNNQTDTKSGLMVN